MSITFKNSFHVGVSQLYCGEVVLIFKDVYIMQNKNIIDINYT